MLSRRAMLRTLAGIAPILGGAALYPALPLWGRLAGGSGGSEPPGPADLARRAPRARFWTTAALAGENCALCHDPARALPEQRHLHAPGVVRCLLCAQGCVLKPGERGRCRARVNVGGELRSLVYGRPMTARVDPIEKKPFYHFLPGSATYSLATSGCPQRCQFCQNWEISQAAPEDYRAEPAPPARVVRAARRAEAPVIAFTYNEPTVFAEYLLEIAGAARGEGVRSVLVSCGIMNEAPLEEMCDRLAAIKIDLKGMRERFYREVCGAELRPVLRTIRRIARRRVHLEVVNLVVPTLNDGEADLRALADWLLGEVGPEVPLHFSRFQPAYRLRHLPPTPVATLERARELALARGLRHVYVGNVPDHPGNHTYCPACGQAVIRRRGFFVEATHLPGGRCGFCGARIAGVWT